MSKGKHGGPRPNSGRRRGSLNVRTQEIVAKAAAEGLMPLEFMLAVLRDETKTFEVRFDAAKSAAPYVHPKLAAVEHSGDKDNPVAYAIFTGVPRPNRPLEMTAEDVPGANDDAISETAH